MLDIANYGFTGTTNVSTTGSGLQGTLLLTSFHASGDKTYTADSAGAIGLK